MPTPFVSGGLSALLTFDRAHAQEISSQLHAWCNVLSADALRSVSTWGNQLPWWYGPWRSFVLRR
jgi:hypothetical protein